MPQSDGNATDRWNCGCTRQAWVFPDTFICKLQRGYHQIRAFLKRTKTLNYIQTPSLLMDHDCAVKNPDQGQTHLLHELLWSKTSELHGFLNINFWTYVHGHFMTWCQNSLFYGTLNRTECSLCFKIRSIPEDISAHSRSILRLVRQILPSPKAGFTCFMHSGS